MSRSTVFLDRLAEAPLIYDGAMGTMIYRRGVFVNACYDELCLRQPELIRGIHRDYVEAGADVVETNTFGANRVKLAAYGLADKVGDINAAAVELAQSVAEGGLLVVGSVGPCLEPDETFDHDRAEELRKAFAEQTAALAEAGVDAIMLETFDTLLELQLAAEEARKTDLPVVASFTIRPEHGPVMGQPPAEFAAGQLELDDNVDVVGINCGTGPAGVLEMLPQIVGATDKPVIAMPNAGGPRELGGRMLYLNSPEYFTEYAKRYIETGVRGVGGCCGTTPQHIRMASRAVKTLSGVKQHVEIAPPPPEDDEREIEPIPTAEKCAFGAKLVAGEPVTSVELLPPRTGGGLAGFLDKCRQCDEAGIDAVNIPDGPRATARISVLLSALAVLRETEIEPIPHYCCRDRNLIGMQSDLLGGYASGLRNWLIITGDPPKLGDYPDATGVFDVDAIGLAQLADALNHGFDAAGEPVDPPTGILIGVGANPVAVEMDREVERYRAKIAAGAEYAITQPIFDGDALLRFMDRVSGFERQLPIIVGLYPLISFRNADFMNNHVPGVHVPDEVLDRMKACRTKEEGIEVGVQISREIHEHVRDAVAGCQASAPLGKIDAALAVLAE